MFDSSREMEFLGTVLGWLIAVGVVGVALIVLGWIVRGILSAWGAILGL